MCLRLTPPPTPLDVHQDGRTALHKAVRAGHKEVVQLLIHKGASLDATDEVLRGAAGEGDTLDSALWLFSLLYI